MRARMNLYTRARVELERRPRFEGSHIGTWVGFRQIAGLVEEGVLQYLREHGVVPGSLFKRYGLCLELLDVDLRLLQPVEMDDAVRIEVRSATDPADRELRFLVELFVGRNGQLVKVAVAEVRALIRGAGGYSGGADPPPPELLPFVRLEIRRASRRTSQPCAFVEGRGDVKALDILQAIVPPGSNAFVWSWHIPYYYCHFTERMQHSACVRALEEAGELFLAERGISVQALLRSHTWIPLVSALRVELLRDAYMGESLYAVYTVEEVFKRRRCTARMDCYVPREGRLVHTATARVTHGYLRLADRGTGGGLTEFDDTVVAALAGHRGAA